MGGFFLRACLEGSCGSDLCALYPFAPGHRDRRGAAVPDPLHAPGWGQGQQLVAAAPPPRAVHEVQGRREEGRDLQRHRSVRHRHHRRGEGCSQLPLQHSSATRGLCAGLTPGVSVGMGDPKELGDPGPWMVIPQGHLLALWQSVLICPSNTAPTALGAGTCPVPQ